MKPIKINEFLVVHSFVLLGMATFQNLDEAITFSQERHRPLRLIARSSASWGDFNMKPSHSTSFQFWKRLIVARNIYHTFLDMSWWKLAPLSLLVYMSLHLLFGLFYWLGGNCSKHVFFYFLSKGRGTLQGKEEITYLDCFFFSIQTMTTIGYGTKIIWK